MGTSRTRPEAAWSSTAERRLKRQTKVERDQNHMNTYYSRWTRSVVDKHGVTSASAFPHQVDIPAKFVDRLPCKMDTADMALGYEKSPLGLISCRGTASDLTRTTPKNCRWHFGPFFLRQNHLVLSRSPTPVAYASITGLCKLSMQSTRTMSQRQLTHMSRGYVHVGLIL